MNLSLPGNNTKRSGQAQGWLRSTLDETQIHQRGAKRIGERAALSILRHATGCGSLTRARRLNNGSSPIERQLFSGGVTDAEPISVSLTRCDCLDFSHCQS